MTFSQLTFRRFAFAVVAGLTASLITSCTSVPHQELSEARRALQAADAAGAREVSAGFVEQIESRIGSAAASLQARDYDRSRREALRAKQSALEVMTVAQNLVTARKDLASRERSAEGLARARRLLEAAFAAAQAGNMNDALEFAGQALKQE